MPEVKEFYGIGTDINTPGYHLAPVMQGIITTSTSFTLFSSETSTNLSSHGDYGYDVYMLNVFNDSLTTDGTVSVKISNQSNTSSAYLAYKTPIQAYSSFTPITAENRIFLNLGLRITIERSGGGSSNFHYTLGMNRWNGY